MILSSIKKRYLVLFIVIYLEIYYLLFEYMYIFYNFL